MGLHGEMTAAEFESVLMIMLLVGVMCVLIRAIARPDIPMRSRVLVSAGLCMMILGHLSYFAEQFVRPHLLDLFGDYQTRQLMRSVICFSGAQAAIAIGLIFMSSKVFAQNKSQQLFRSVVEKDTELNSLRSRLDGLLRSSLGGTIFARPVRDAQGEITDFQCVLVNQMGEQLLGRSARYLTTCNLFREFACLHEHNLLDAARGLMETRLPFTTECRLGNDAHGQGGRWYQLAAVHSGDGMAVTFADITDRRRIEEQLRYAAEHDALSGLLNRLGLRKRLKEAINRHQHGTLSGYAVMFLDFDRFKLVNDTLGHDVGDQLIVSIADRMRANLRAIDVDKTNTGAFFAARIGGDEFVIFLSDVEHPQTALTIAERLQRDLKEPHRIGGHEVVSTASIGVVTSEHKYTCPDEILHDADTAMYEAKQAGRGTNVVFDEHMRQQADAKREFEEELRDAIKRQAFQVAFQPIVSLDSGEIVGAEALLRWPHPTRGMLLPDRFLTAAEEMGLIKSVGQWAMRESCSALHRWLAQGAVREPFTLGVNFSRAELLAPNLVQRVTEILEETDVPLSAIHLEIPERTLMADLDLLQPALQDLHARGVTLVMDDFGAGESSLSKLNDLPFDMIKIDRTLLTSTRSSRDNAAILNTIVQMAENMQMRVVAEGIETEDQLSVLQGLGCAYGQGWLFAEAVSADEFIRLLDRRRRIAFRRHQPDAA
jgi:diguanylate cyclase (GGDEF)-like protein